MQGEDGKALFQSDNVRLERITNSGSAVSFWKRDEMNYALGHFAECTTFLSKVDDDADATLEIKRVDGLNNERMSVRIPF